MSREDTQVNVRLRADILDRLKASAAASGASITTEINRLLDAAAPASTETVQFKARLPAALHAAIASAAKDSGRTINAEIVKRLQESL